MQFSVISRVLGMLILIFSISLIPSLIIGWWMQDNSDVVFFNSLVISILVGLILWFPNRKIKNKLRKKDSYLIVIGFWLSLVFVGLMPFWLFDSVTFSFANALFESMSGLTTTGATIIPNIDGLPISLLFYRQLLQWLGGMGIIVLAVAVLPVLGIGGAQLYKAETPGPIKDSKLTPKIADTAKVLWLIYSSFTIICTIAYWIAGMSVFDAICHAFSTVAVGGFSTHNESLGYFQSVGIDTIAIVFMFLSGTNFALHFYAIRKGSIKYYLQDIEFKAYILINFLAVVFVCLVLYFSNEYNSLVEAIRYGTFQVISVSTTTGFATAEFHSWIPIIPALLLFLSFAGGCAGSTGGGMKIIRIVLLFLQGKREIVKLIHTNALITIKIATRSVREDIINKTWGFFAIYILSFVIIILALLATGMNELTAYSATVASLNNLGPGLGDVAKNYASVSDSAKFILAFAMLLGRLEIFTLIVIFTKTFWKT